MDHQKAQVLAKLDEALSQNLVDEDVAPLLVSINNIEELVTTSSCSGRVQVISLPGPGDKRRSKVLGKWHRPVSDREVMDSISSWDGEGELHFLVQPLLIHIRCRDLVSAVKLRNLGHGMGLKFSTIRSLKLDKRGDPLRWGTVVELLGTERIEVPVDGIIGGVLETCIPEWVKKGNSLLRRTKGHIPVLKQELDDNGL
ncbi:MAG: hypothetical protein U9R75_03665 [Candidatus Thermoplasmatota archaeon]|nr:hypothetical protein [Candidatus Thermoplasmatota archaeon]